jgi:hypothetical protein
MQIPQIQIRTQNASIGINADPGMQEIEQPKATFEMHSTPAQLSIVSPPGELYIDQSKAWDALGLSNFLNVLPRISEAAKQIALEGIARIVENGNRMAAIQIKSNAFADIAESQALEYQPAIDYLGEASYLNVSERYYAHKPEIDVIPGRVDINTHPNPPVISYQRGKLDIYPTQYAKVEIIPPQIDLKR